LGRPAKEAAVMIAGSGGVFKIRSVIANNTVQDEEVSDITLGKFPRSADIHGTDDRYPFTDSRFPFCTVGLVQSRKNQTHVGICTGTMVGPRHMLTASHCINFGSDNGLMPTSFAPSFDAGDAPFGLFECEKVYFLVLTDKDGDGYVSDHEAAFDYAVCVLDEYPQTGHMGSRVYDSAWNGKPLWNHIGYPEDYDLDGEIPNPIFSQNGTVLDTQTHIVDTSSLFPGTGEIEGYLLSTNIDADSGQSGGPVFAQWEGDDGGFYVIAVMSASSPPGLVFLINSALEDYP
jgi:V8-like Glu-specific endopeptidase